MYNRRKFLVGAAAIAAPAIVSRAHARPVQIKIGHISTLQSGAHAAARAFGDFLKEHGEGRLDIDTFPLSVLGNEANLVRALVDGSLEACLVPNAIVGSYADEVTLIEYPYLFQSLEHARKSLDGKFGAHIASKLEPKGLMLVGWPENGQRHITARRPIRTPEDLKGLKLRVQPNKLHIEVFKGLGAEASPLLWTELAAAMRAGQFEAQENPLINTATNEFLLELQTHVSLTSHVYSPYPVLFSKYAWQRLNATTRDLIMEAGSKAVAASRDFTEKGIASSMKVLEQRKFTVVSDVDVPAFQRAVEALQPRIAQHINVDALRELKRLL